MQHDRHKEDRRRGLLEELKGLFGPAFGPALEAYGRSFAERVSQDEHFRAEVADRFERGRALGGFPELEGVIGSMTPCERDGFFRIGWTETVLPPSVGPEDPWDLPPWDGDMEGYREDLYGGMACAATDLPQHFYEWIEELLRIGYYGTREASDLPLKKQAGQLSGKPRPLPLYGESYPVHLENSRQTLWLDLEGSRTHLGYRQPTITDRPLKTDNAIFCAVTCLEGREIDIPLLREVLPNLLPGLGQSFRETWTKAMSEHPREFRKKLQKLGSPAPLDYVLLLLRHHRSDFDDLTREDRIGLISNACSHINSLLDTTSKTLNYVEYGTPAKGAVPSHRTAGRDIESVVLRDVVGLTYREIGERLGIPPPKDISYKGDHPTARKTVGRGRKLLYAALGEEGWILHAESMKADIARWQAMSNTHREAEAVAEASDLTYETALEQVEEEQRHRT
ncbi:RNA polymerase sigma factor [Rubrobacter indicoceani]|uniref:RNA polymerase sigma factor n=1 Tax=Rubrobacter indicoceani TaxID=2051957 RepID=UPI0013C4239A|nr:hypothetical protein [Rubrobacter indicoceani]